MPTFSPASMSSTSSSSDVSWGSLVPSHVSSRRVTIAQYTQCVVMACRAAYIEQHTSSSIQAPLPPLPCRLGRLMNAFYAEDDAHHTAGAHNRQHSRSKIQPRGAGSCWSKMVLRDVDDRSRAAAIAVACRDVQQTPRTTPTPNAHVCARKGYEGYCLCGL
jgi:hypothetical protein